MSHDSDAPVIHATLSPGSTTALARSSRGRIHRTLKGTMRLFGPSLVVAFVAPFVFPGVRKAVRPVAKGLINGGLTLTESFKEAAAAARAQVSDLVAEAKADRQREADQLTSSPDDKV